MDAPGGLSIALVTVVREGAVGREEVGAEYKVRRVGVVAGLFRGAGWVEAGAGDDALNDPCTLLEIEFVAGLERGSARALIADEDAVGELAEPALVIDSISVPGEGAMVEDEPGAWEDGDDAVVIEGILAFPGTGVGDVASEEAVDDPGLASPEEIEGGTGDLGAVVSEDAILDENELVGGTFVLDGDPAGTGAGVIVGDFQVTERGVGPVVDFHGAAITKVKPSFTERAVGFDPVGSVLGDEVVGTGELEMLDDGVGGEPIPQVEDVVDDGGCGGGSGNGEFGIGSGQGGAADSGEVDAVVGAVEGEEGLARALWAVGSRVKEEVLVGGVGGGEVGDLLEVVPRMDMVAVGFQFVGLAWPGEETEEETGETPNSREAWHDVASRVELGYSAGGLEFPPSRMTRHEPLACRRQTLMYLPVERRGLPWVSRARNS